jgi:hypothetical protein
MEEEEEERNKGMITRTEKLKIAGLISVAGLIFIIMIWSSFESQIQQLIALASQKIGEIYIRINSAFMVIPSDNFTYVYF